MHNKVLALSAFLLTVGVTSGFGVTFSWDFDNVISGGYVTVPEEETLKGNVGVFGGFCEINGGIDGDLTVCGGDVWVNGNVTGDLVAFGGNVVISGDCAGTASAFGGSVSLTGDFAGPAETGGGSVQLGGNFRDAVEAGGGAVFLEGAFAGPVKAEGEKVFVGPGASLNAGLSYAGELVQDPSAWVEGPVRVIEYEEPEAEKEERSIASKVVSWFAWRLGEFLALMLFAFLVWAARPGCLKALPEKMRRKPWQVPLLGLVVTLGLDLLIIVLFVTVIGIPSALAVLTLSLIFLYASWVFVGTCVGDTILKPVFKEKGYPVLFATAVGALILVFGSNLLWLIPFYVGFALYLLFCFGVIWYGFGAGTLYWWSQRKAAA